MSILACTNDSKFGKMVFIILSQIGKDDIICTLCYILYLWVLIMGIDRQNKEKACKGCGEVFILTVHNREFCSKECHYKNYVSTKYSSVCLCCGKDFKHSSSNTKYCSISCSAKANAAHLYQDGKKRCSGCKQMFDISLFKVKKYNGQLRPHCPECHRNRINAMNYKRRQWTAQIDTKLDITLVFNKCGWRCSYCGCETPKSLRGKFVLNAPELDHIVPLSKGGNHSYENVTLSCRGCNLSKSNKLNYAKTRIRTAAVLN
jgi:5-methylcytosine-specific restriction endonuclease McrA